MEFVLVLHNLLRWAVVVLMVYALGRMVRGLVQKREFTGQDRKALSWFAISMDVQLLLGLVLYISNGWWSTLPGGMSQSAVRFFAVEHLFMMVIAWVLAHVAALGARAQRLAPAQFRRATLLVGIAVLTILVSIPWPWAAGHGRPLFRLAELWWSWLV
jgi:hypothetical protein